MATCKFCRQPIEWKRLGERWIPYEDNWTRHQCDGKRVAVEPVRNVTGEHALAKLPLEA